MAGGRDGQEFVLETGGGGVEGLLVPRAGGDVHHIGTAAVAGIDADELAGEQAGDIGADQADIRSVGIICGLGLVELADLRTGKALESGVAGQFEQGIAAADAGFDFGALGSGGGVHPDRGGLAREDAGELVFERLVGGEIAQGRGSGIVEIDGAVLLAAAGDGLDLA